MRTIQAIKKQVDPDLLGRAPKREEWGELLDEDCNLVQDGRVIAAYRILPPDIIKNMRTIAVEADMAKTKRMNGTPTQSAVYGMMPRSAGRGMEYCRFTVASQKRHDHMRMIRDFNDLLVDIYRTNFPDSFAEAMRGVEEVHPDWRWMSGPFLTCNFNVNYAIPYHLDAGNMKQALSNVLVIKNRIQGGELVCPEYDITFSQRDGALILFHGYDIIHGVMPIQEVRGLGPAYRASIVYYTLKQCRNCLSRGDEAARAKAQYDKHMHKSQEDRLAAKIKQRDLLRRKK